MKGIVNAYTNVPLILRIVIGLVIGVILALVVPNVEWIAFLGTMFTSALKAIAPILVFFLVMGALSTARSAGNMKTVIILYIASTVVAGILAVIASFAFPSELVLTGVDAADATGAPQELSSVIVALLTNALSNPVDALASANYLGVLMWAVFIGIALRKAKSTTKDLLQETCQLPWEEALEKVESEGLGLLKDCPFVLSRVDDISGRIAYSELRNAGISKPRTVAVSGNLSTIMVMCAEGIGAGFCPMNILDLSDNVTHDLLRIHLSSQASYMISLGTPMNAEPWKVMDVFKESLVDLCTSKESR